MKRDEEGSAGASPSQPLGSLKCSMVRKLFRLLKILLLTYLFLVLGMMIFENSLIFFPTRYPGGIWKPPGLEFEDAYFEAADATKLHGWYVPHDDPRAVVLFAHGNGGNLSHRWDTLKELNDNLGVSVMIFDYRGYGRSEGSPNEKGVLADARAARAWLAQRAGIPESEIVLMGESLGGAVLVDLAAADGARGLVLDITFSSLPDVAAYHYPWAPIKLLMRSRLDSFSKIPNYHGPLLQLHGDADTIVPFKFGRKLFDAANEPKTFVTIPGRDHNDGRTRQFYEAVHEFLNQLNEKPKERSSQPTRVAE